MPRSAFRAHAREACHRAKLCTGLIMLGVPLGARPAHVMQFGPIGVDEISEHTLEKIGKADKTAFAAVRCSLSGHVSLPRISCRGAMVAAILLLCPGLGMPRSGPIIGPNLLK